MKCIVSGILEFIFLSSFLLKNKNNVHIVLNVILTKSNSVKWKEIAVTKSQNSILLATIYG